MKRQAAIFFLLTLALGLYGSAQINRFLGIEFHAKELPPLPHYGRALPTAMVGRDSSAALPIRLADMGAVGILPDTAAWRAHDYSHNSRALEDLYTDGPPYIDPQVMARIEGEFRAYVDRLVRYGYNGLVGEGFLSYINFDTVGDGRQIYPTNSPYRSRHRAMRQHFSRLYQYARDHGLKVYLRTDMLALTPPLENYLREHLGRIDAEDPRLWQIYSAGLEELFAEMPMVDGVMLRIGEAGGIYNREGWDYYSRLHVRTDAAVRHMLEAFCSTAARHQREIIFRTWSVGVGRIGDMHTNPKTYGRVLSDIDAPNLIVSTKFVMGDFDSYLPLNPTLYGGRQRRIVEFQARREFEAFNAFLNDMGPEHQVALAEFLRTNPHIEGIWLWTQGGGPPRAGPLSLYPFHGFWLPIDLNVYATARLGLNPHASMRRIREDWVRQTLSNDPATVALLSEVTTRSRSAVLKGLYIGSYARQQLFALGLEPPPMMWIFKWDFISGSSAALSAVYVASRDSTEVAIAEGREAVTETEAMIALLDRVDTHQVYDPRDLDLLRQSLRYQHSLFTVLAEYRAFFLSLYRWLDTGRGAAQTRDYLRAYQTARDAHLQAYATNLSFPAYNFLAADLGATLAARTPSIVWCSRALLALALGLLLAGWRNITPDLRALWQSAFSPWSLPQYSVSSRAPLTALALTVLTYLAFASFNSPNHALLLLVCIGTFTGAALLMRGRLSPAALLSALAGTMLLKGTLLAGVLAVRGPLFFWYHFWTSPDFRLVYVTLSLALFLWVFYGLYCALYHAGACSRANALGRVIACAAAPLIVVGAGVQWIGLETALTELNDQLAVLPLGLSRILGIATHLNIPQQLPLGAALIGCGLAAIGGALHLLDRKQPQTEEQDQRDAE